MWPNKKYPIFGCLTLRFVWSIKTFNPYLPASVIACEECVWWMASFRCVHIEMQRRVLCVGECSARTRTPAHCGGWWCWRRPPVDPQSSSSALGPAMLPLAAALLFAAVAVSQTTVPQTSVTQTPGPDLGACPPDKLTAYRVVLHTFWTREMFPKHYPEWRPPAQWSKLIGESEYLLTRKALRILRIRWTNHTKTISLYFNKRNFYPVPEFE